MTTKFKDLLTEKGYNSVAQFSEATGVPGVTINRYTSGNFAITVMSLLTAKIFAKALGVTIDDIYDTAEDVDKVNWQEGWNDINDNFSIFVEDGKVIRGLTGSDLNQKPVYLYRLSGGGLDRVEPLEVKDFLKRTRRGGIIWQ